MGPHRRILNYPLTPCPRVALFASGFEAAPEVVVASPQNAETFAAPARALRPLRDSLPPPMFPVVVFTGPDYGTLTESDRDWVWRTFGVPVFEQMYGPSGELIAEECDAHDGLHLVGHAPDGMRMEWSECGCGRKEPRLFADSAEALAAAG